MVIDASVAVKWVVSEPRRDLARDLLREDISRFAPDLLLSEVSNALRKKHRIGEIGFAQAHAALDDLGSYFEVLLPAVDTLHESFQYGVDFDHATMDCAYLAVARRVGGVLVTDDMKFVEKCRRFGHASIALSLTDWLAYRQASSLH